MKSIHIRQIDEETLEGLKRRARLHRRSLQKEIETLLDDAARMVPLEEGEAEESILSGLKLVSTSGRKAEDSREAMYGDDGR